MTLREAASRLRPPRVAEAEWCGRQTLEFDWADDLLGQPAPRPEGPRRRAADQAGLPGREAGLLPGHVRPAGTRHSRPSSSARHSLRRLALPGRWRRADGTGEWGPLYSVGCDGFSGHHRLRGGPYVELHDTGAIDLLLRRRQEARLRRLREAEEEKERRRRVFKP